jgi:glycosyltransferase involved in cell wall biosynthesis
MSDPAGFPATHRAMWMPIWSSTGIPPLVPDDMPRDSGGANLVEPESHTSLAEGMRRLASDTGLRTTLGANARAYAERKFAKQPALERLEAVLLG